MEAYLSDAFLDRVRRAYSAALHAGARTQGGMWQAIDARRRDVHEALVADGNAPLRAIFADPVATDLYFGTANLCRSIMGSSDGRPFLELALESARARRARFQLERLSTALNAIGGSEHSVVEIGPGVGLCAFYAYRAGLTDYTTVDLPLGVVAQARFLAEALSPDKVWMDGDPDEGARDQIKLFSVARSPDRQFDAALNVDSMTEMSLKAAQGYASWINQHARMFLPINHELNAFTVADLARCSLNGVCLERTLVTDQSYQPYYFEEKFLVDRSHQANGGLFLLRMKTFFWRATLAIQRRAPLLQPKRIVG
jgi:hypothetical protein